MFYFSLRGTLGHLSYNLQNKDVIKVNLVSENSKIAKFKSKRNLSFRTGPLPTFKFGKFYSGTFIYFIAIFQMIINLMWCCAAEFLQRSTSKLLDISRSPFGVFSDESFSKFNVFWPLLDSHVLLANCVFIHAGSGPNSNQYFIPGSCRDQGIWEDVSERDVSMLRFGGLLCLSAARIWKYSLILLIDREIYSSIAIISNISYIKARENSVLVARNVTIYDILNF